MATPSDFRFLASQYHALDKDFQTLSSILKTALSTIKEQRAEKQCVWKRWRNATCFARGSALVPCTGS